MASGGKQEEENYEDLRTRIGIERQGRCKRGINIEEKNCEKSNWIKVGEKNQEKEQMKNFEEVFRKWENV